MARRERNGLSRVLFRLKATVVQQWSETVRSDTDDDWECWVQEWGQSASTGTGMRAFVVGVRCKEFLVLNFGF